MKSKTEVNFNNTFRKVANNCFFQILMNIVDRFKSTVMDNTRVDISKLSKAERDSVILLSEQEDGLIAALTLGKTIVSNIDNKAEVFDILDKNIALRVIDDVLDIVYISRANTSSNNGKIELYSFEKLEKQINFIRSRTVEFLRNKNIGFELYISVNGLTMDISNYNSYGQEAFATILSAAAQLINLYLISLVPYIIKLKNSKIKDCEYNNTNDKIVLKYYSGNMFEKNILQAVSKNIESRKDYFKQSELFNLIEEELQKGRIMYINKVTSLDLSAKRFFYTIKDDLGDYPFMTEGKPHISIEKLHFMSSKRKYATSKNVLIDILDKSKNIDSVEIEDINQDEMIINVKFINNKKSIYFMNLAYAEQKTFGNNVKTNGLETSPYIYMRFVIDKKNIDNNIGYSKNNIDSIISNASNFLFSCNTSYSYTDDDSKNNTYMHSLKIHYFICCCIYILYCDINYKGVKLYSLEKKQRHSSNQQRVIRDVLRVAHIRKLPSEWSASEKAKANAVKYNMIIPNGYTFVKEHFSHDEDKKIIKIRG